MMQVIWRTKNAKQTSLKSKPIGKVWPLLALLGLLFNPINVLAKQNNASQNPSQTSTDKPADSVFDSVVSEAKALAAKSYVDSSTKSTLAKALLDINYQQYRSIRFKAEHALWRGESDYEVQFFHPGFLYRDPVQIVDVKPNDKMQLIPFEPDWFSYDGEAAHLSGLDKSNAGYAGFRVHYPLNNQDYKDEFAVFLGASYFRLIGAGQNYGISARGLAIDTAEASGEEFPHFKRFWLAQPHKGQPLVMYALLDSPSVSAAYRFVLQPGADTTAQISATVFARKNVKKLGLAPLTSMYLFGENSRHHFDDFRPEVHDSDGLLMQTGQGEWIWRPLTNPQHLQVTSLSDENPQGFGLLQRDTDFEHYLDAEANYQKRPGLWIEPQGQWGKGRVELVEIPTDSETNDNIVSYWVSATPLLAGDSRSFAYSLATVSGNPVEFQHSQVIRTRQGTTDLPGFKENESSKQRRFVVDFDAKGFPPRDGQNPPSVDLQVSHGKAKEIRIMPILDGQVWRVTFILTADNEQQAVDMRLFINSDSKRISEVWNYVWKNNTNS